MNYRALICRGVGALALAATLASGASAQLWRTTRPSPFTNNPALTWVSQSQSYLMDAKLLRRALNATPRGEWWTVDTPNTIDIPLPSGRTQKFRIIETPIMTPELEAQTNVKTYQLRGVDDKNATGCLDFGVLGLRGMVISNSGTYVLEPAWFGSTTVYASYWKKNNLQPGLMACLTEAQITPEGPGVDGPGDTLRRYRLAMNATAEYTTFYGSEAAAMNGVVTSVNRQNSVYVRDVAVRMEIVRNKCYTNAATDPFTNNSGGTMLGQNQTITDTELGDANYDIGHVFSTGGGGIAGLGVIRVSGQKARGVTGSPSPIGDGFDIDYVAHEMGHQFGANHTFNSTASSCGGGNRSASSAYEVGSGTTIMAYAGICGIENVQSNSDAYFHIRSIEEIYNTIAIRGFWIGDATGNTTPTVSVGGGLTIPQSTPIRLSGTGADANGDTLTYCWEQWDLGTATTDPSQFSTGPLVRSLSPVSTGVRFVPKFATVRDGLTDNWEKLPNTNRNFTWRLTVRDNRAGGGGYAVATQLLTVSGAAFAVTAPNGGGSLNGGAATTVTWTVGGGSSAANVRILLSTDSGNSYSAGTATVLLASTPNDGSESVTLPNINTNTARIIVEAVGNVFYDISNTNFAIVAQTAPAITSLVPNTRVAQAGAFTLTVNGSGFVNGCNVRWNGSNRTTTFVNANQVTASIPASDVLYTGNATVTVQNPSTLISNGLNFSITPGPVTTVNPTLMEIITGALLQGDVNSLHNDDNVFVAVGNDFFDPNGQMRITGTSPYATLFQFQLIVKHWTSRPSLAYIIEAEDQTNGVWNVLGSGPASLSAMSATYTVPQASNPTKYVRAGDNRMRARFRWVPTADLTAVDGWWDAVDRMVWTVQP